MRRLLIIVISALMFFSACGLFQTREEKSAQELVADGMAAYEKKKYRSSIESFQKLKDWYPFSKYAILAELKIADAYFFLDEYEEAIAAYESFEALHPRNEAAPYVIYQLGMSYVNQMETIDRDQLSARKAIETFNRLKRLFPNDSYSLKADGFILKATQNLVAHDFYIAEYYYRQGRYPAALLRFRSIISDYPDVGIHQKALVYIPLCEAKIAEQEAKKK
ncbi:MAG: outer membrane protein assembly factor BamD [Desulfatirhabdiaceae bacterium]